MTPPEPNPIDNPVFNPEPKPPEKRYALDRYEGGLIVLLLVVVLGSQMVDQWIPAGDKTPLKVIHGTDSAAMGPIQLHSPSPFKPLPRRDLNEITRSELLAISGIGPAMAEAILSYREKKGGFRKIEELEGVPGVGPKRLEMFSQFLTVGNQEPGVSTDSSSDPLVPLVADPQDPKSSSNLEESPSQTLNLNQASRTQLMEIPGIGEAFADRILEERERLGGFETWSQVDEVSGVGPKRLENIKRHATIH